MPETGDLVRYALKLATGTGKTMVMATLIAWATVHRAKVSGSTPLGELPGARRPTSRFAIECGAPIPSRSSRRARANPGSPENLYDEFDMVPPQFREVFHPNVHRAQLAGHPAAGRRETTG